MFKFSLIVVAFSAVVSGIWVERRVKSDSERNAGRACRLQSPAIQGLRAAIGLAVGVSNGQRPGSVLRRRRHTRVHVDPLYLPGLLCRPLPFYHTLQAVSSTSALCLSRSSTSPHFQALGRMDLMERSPTCRFEELARQIWPFRPHRQVFF